jgi:hypothetical protein
MASQRQKAPGSSFYDLLPPRKRVRVDEYKTLSRVKTLVEGGAEVAPHLLVSSRVIGHLHCITVTSLTRT